MSSSRDDSQAFDVVVIGGGSGGFGAALAAARRGLSVLLVEAGPMLGGNATLGGVNTWEPGVGGPGFHGELFELLSTKPHAIGLGRTTHFWSYEQPWGFSTIEPGHQYRDSLRRAGVAPEKLIRVTFEPDAMADAMAKLLQQTGRVTLLLNTKVIAVEASQQRVTRAILESHGQHRSVEGRFFVDATAQIHVCRMLNCATALGAESQATYDEPCAPNEPKQSLNGVTVCFRITPREPAGVDPLPADVPEEVPVASGVPGGFSLTQYPNGDVNVNPLPTMEGIEFHRLGPDVGRRECVQRTYRMWKHMQTQWGFDRYRLLQIFPFTGVREGPRLLAQRVLTENDVRAGVSQQRDTERHIAIADHALDVHGEGHLLRELTEPYGVPWDCLLPREFSNLAVACRGAGFSHIAAASCRLSRTMMQLGHAAGLAAAVATRTKTQFPDVDVSQIRQLLRDDNAPLEFA